MPDHTLTFNELMLIYEQQDGLCYYSGIPLDPVSGNTFTLSLERLDNSLSYSYDNCVLIIQLMNSCRNHAQWSRRKVLTLLNEKRTDTGEKLVLPVMFPATEERAFILRLLRNAKSHTKQRVAKGRNMPDVEIDVEWFLAQTKQQNASCYYSGMPLSFKPKTEWQCSIQRLSNDTGYTPNNCVLICLEFQTAAHWSREVFSTVYKSMVRKYEKEDDVVPYHVSSETDDQEYDEDDLNVLSTWLQYV